MVPQANNSDDATGATSSSELSLADCAGRLRSQTAAGIQAVPSHLCPRFAPATYCLFEWSDYWLECDGADGLRVGDERLEPISRGLFRVRFENQLGLTYLQPYQGHKPLCQPLFVEVISRKFPSPAHHLSFFSTLLNDLFARAARIPFTTSAPTSRSVTEALQPPTPLFVFHFLIQHAFALRTALAIIQAAPHRRLTDHPSFVALADAKEADVDVMISILHSPKDWVRASGSVLVERLHGYAPARVWQRQPEETFNTPENRFVLFFIRELLTAAESLPMQTWWGTVSDDRKRIVREAASALRYSVSLPLFAGIRPMQQFPSSSRVLMLREGYREIFLLWQSFQRARRPLFAHLRHAIDVRDVAKLYEIWAFFALVEEISSIMGQTPVLDLPLSDESGLSWRAEASFGTLGRLVYNLTQPSYSIPLRPDFTWIRHASQKVVLDAKFRLNRRLVESSDEELGKATAQPTDLYKMHTYRDALGVRAAVSIYPGGTSIFYHWEKGKDRDYTLRDLLTGCDEGVGAIALTPREAN
jgi:uncharacterized protein